MLGVMIQGAMRKVTVSVKYGTSGSVWGENEDSVGPAGSPIRLQDPAAPSLPVLEPPRWSLKPLILYHGPQRHTYLGVHQADAERDQPQEISVGKGEPLHVEADLPFPRMPLHFVVQLLGPQHLLVV